MKKPVFVGLVLVFFYVMDVVFHQVIRSLPWTPAGLIPQLWVLWFLVSLQVLTFPHQLGYALFASLLVSLTSVHGFSEMVLCLWVLVLMTWVYRMYFLTHSGWHLFFYVALMFGFFGFIRQMKIVSDTSYGGHWEAQAWWTALAINGLFFAGVGQAWMSGILEWYRVRFPSYDG
jgi:hypothetical protein